MRGARRLWLAQRFTLVFSLGVVTLAGMLALAAELYLRRTLSAQSELRARSIVQSVAAVARPYLLHYDYIVLQQMADAVLAEPDLAYVVILDKEGKVAGYGGRRDLQGTRLDGRANQRALLADDVSVQQVQWSGADGTIPVVEVMSPVRVAEDQGSRWGTVRAGLSLAPIHEQLWRARLFLLLIAATGVLGAAWASHFLAGRITRPLRRLVDATARLEADSFDPSFKLETGDEIEELAERFSSAAQSLGRQRRELLAAKEELTSVNAGLEQEVLRRTREVTESRERYRLLVEGSPDAFALLEKSRFVFVNQAFVNIFQYPQDVVLAEGFRWTQLIHPNFQRLARERFRAAEETGRTFRVEVVGLTRTGRPVNLEVRGRAVVLQGGAALELVLSDVTEKRRLLGQVVQSERLRAMGEMTAMVAHHFNNLLAVMLGRCQLLQMKAKDDSIRSGLEVIQSSALKAGEMLRHLQEYYGEQVDLRFAEVDLNALLKELVVYQENIWRTTRPPEAPLITIRLDLSPLPAVRGSDPLLQDVFHRVLMNAAEAMPQGGEIVVRTSAREAEVLVVIEDPGTGMQADVVQHAFEPFFTTKGPRTRGLGLSAALGIVQRHEGRIRIDSTPGRGTRVEIRLPVQSRIARIVPLHALQGGADPAAPAKEDHEERRTGDAG